ncbi:MAG: DUF1684 domain-containing protein [Vicinamibacterales bacterium]
MPTVTRLRGLSRLTSPATRLGVFSLLALAATAGCTSGPSKPVDTRTYDQQIAADRVDKDLAFRTSDSSPLLPADRPGFPGINYYPIDESFRVPARLVQEASPTPVIIELENSQHERERMRRVGRLRFTIGDAEYTLAAFIPAEARTVDRLFVPFGDLTSGAETYKGGRYLDLDRTPTGLYDLDFNRAYHPNCVYNDQWICPVPPQENRLPIAITAGEKLPAGKN